jgi:hypothetical protein
MITVTQLVYSIGRRARGNDFTKLTLSEQFDVLEAANTALQEIYNSLPAYFKELTEGFLLPAPTTVTLSPVQGSNQLASSLFTAAEIGRSIVLPGDSSWNQIIGASPDTLLNPYLGPTGTVVSTIYGDAVYSTRYPFDRIVGNPRFAQGATGLINIELAKAPSQLLSWPFQQTVGRPLTWWVQPLGNSQGNEPLLVLRVSPAPDQNYAINARMSYWPKLLTQADYDNATTIPVPDQFVNKSLIPIAIEALMSTPTWDKSGDKAQVLKQAEDGRQFAKNQLGSPSTPANQIGTPLGF